MTIRIPTLRTRTIRCDSFITKTSTLTTPSLRATRGTNGLRLARRLPAFQQIRQIVQSDRIISADIQLSMSSVSSSSMQQNESPRVVNIGIIGAGPAGLVAARVVSRTIQQLQHDHQLHHFVITVFEKENDIGGVWRYKPNMLNHDTGTSESSATKKSHPMYRHLRTNIPKEIMAYREFPWKAIAPSVSTTTATTAKNHLIETSNQTTISTDNNISYLSHYNVYDYLHNYCQQYQLHNFIQYHCSVRQLTCLPTNRSYFSPSSSLTATDDDSEVWPLIRLTWDKMNPATETTQPQSDIFDAIFICNGHYNVPSFPDIPGLHEYFNGTLMHSMEYDIPDPFINQTVLCIGGRASGSDIAREIANHHQQHGELDGQQAQQLTTTKIYLSDTSFPKASSSSSDRITQNNVTWVPKTVRILPDGRVQLDSDCIEPIYVDTIILCTGYDYDFPFINDASNMKDFIGCARRRVQLLYEQLWYVSAPNIAFIGIPHSIIPFPLFEFQCEAVVQSWFRSTPPPPTAAVPATTIFPTLPSKKVRHTKAMIDANSGGYGKEKGRIPEDTHYLGPSQWDYCRTMARYANIYNNAIEAYIATNKVRMRFIYQLVLF
jgi:Flavin-binding monooxygenase-like/NAD(P)-binding Rossmann-like domain